MNIGLRIVLGDVLAKHGLELRGRAHECLAVEVAGVLARAAVPLPRWVCHRGRPDITGWKGGKRITQHR